MSANLTDLAQILNEYMWSQRPPLNPSKLSEQLGVGRSTVANWLTYGARPSPEMLALIAQKTKIHLSKLLRACGYPVPDDIWGYIADRLGEDATITNEMRQEMASRIAEWRQEYQATQECAEIPG